MLKQTLALVGLTLSLFTNATILSVDSSFGADTITRDTEAGLDWLDVTESRGLSYAQVIVQMGAGGVYEGWRYATASELDQLIVNFGYIRINTECAYGLKHCDTDLTGDYEVIDLMIRTLGDTRDAQWDAAPHLYPDALPDGAGYTKGFLGTSSMPNSSAIDTALIFDQEYFIRDSPHITFDYDDEVHTRNGGLSASASSNSLGSFLVRPTFIPAPIAGDINGDGSLSVSDLLMMQQAVVGERILESAEFYRADLSPVGGDGEITVADLLALTKSLLNNDF